LNSSQKDAIDDQLKQEKLDRLTETEKKEFEQMFQQVTQQPGFLEKPKRSTWRPLLDKFIQLTRISDGERVTRVKQLHPAIDDLIEQKYVDRVFILKNGSLESYIGSPHADLQAVIHFCETSLSLWLSGTRREAIEIRFILNSIANPS
jgi:hypothetical protein